jgi:hypothetical protein
VHRPSSLDDAGRLTSYPQGHPNGGDGGGQPVAYNDVEQLPIRTRRPCTPAVYITTSDNASTPAGLLSRLLATLFLAALITHKCVNRPGFGDCSFR